MSNTSPSTVLSFSPARVAYIFQGISDKLFDFPFPRAYDTWRRDDQRNYENARLTVANCHLAGIKMPLFPTITPQNYNKYKTLRASAITKVGSHSS